MSSMNIALPETLKDFVDARVKQGAYGSRSEYARELIRKVQQRLELRDLLVAGVTSPSAAPVTPEYFDALRARVPKATKAGPRR